jgi:hypothetical protein
MAQRINKALWGPIALWLIVLIWASFKPLVADELEEDFGRSTQGDSWRFQVFLDNREVGFHEFRLAQAGEFQQMHSIASFEYKLFFVRLFHYEHENREIWSGDCLQRIDSQTDMNGKPYKVNGRIETGEFRVDMNSGEVALPECVMSFAYWNPTFLKQRRLLNTQDGEYLDIEVSDPVYEELEVKGERLPSWRYRLAAGDRNVDLWYSNDDEWLALESEVQGGRLLRYVLL